MNRVIPSQLKAMFDRAEVAVEHNLNVLGYKTRDESGAVSTETAVLMAVLVAVAVAVGGILITKAETVANGVNVDAGQFN